MTFMIYKWKSASTVSEISFIVVHFMGQEWWVVVVVVEGGGGGIALLQFSLRVYMVIHVYIQQ